MADEPAKKMQHARENVSVIIRQLEAVRDRYHKFAGVGLPTNDETRHQDLEQCANTLGSLVAEVQEQEVRNMLTVAQNRVNEISQQYKRTHPEMGLTPHKQRLRQTQGCIGALDQIKQYCIEPTEPEPTGGGGNYVDNWLKLALGELHEFNKHGARYITSCSEALIPHAVSCEGRRAESRRRD